MTDDDLRPRGTVTVQCACGTAFWIDPLDPRLPAGPFLCLACAGKTLMRTPDGILEVDARFAAAANSDFLGNIEICVEPECPEWLELRRPLKSSSEVDLRDAFWEAARKLGWTGEPNRARCPKHGVS